METVIRFPLQIDTLVTYKVCKTKKEVEDFKNEATKLKKTLYNKLSKKYNRLFNAKCCILHVKSNTYVMELVVEGVHEVMVEYQTESVLRTWGSHECKRKWREVENLMPDNCDLYDSYIDYIDYNVHKRHEDLRKDKVIIK